ncbi:YhgE/Pip domain-containing protein [Streptomyces sp. NPDC057910]|uniref:YhgE/Pip domain-containing protein n=1 Tax=Streptomyces sp. NPDC057910 TaxID=3346278 RepID=UPI0036E4F769
MRLAWYELQRFRGSRLQWIPVALVVLPVVTAALCWASLSSPHGRLSHVPAAIVNLDTGAKLPSSSGGTATTVQVGRRLVDDLTLSRAFEWRQLDEGAARAQLKTGKIYFALIIPKGFSSAISQSVQRKDGPAASLMLLLDDGNGYLIGKAAVAEAGTIRERVTTLSLGYMAEQTTDVWKDVRSGLDKALNAVAASQAAPDQNQAPSRGVSGMDQLVTQLNQATTALSQVNDTLQTLKSNSGAMASQLNTAAASAQSAQDNAGSNNGALQQQSTAQTNTAVRLAQGSVTGLDGQLQAAVSTVKSLQDQLSSSRQSAQTFSSDAKNLQQQLQHLAQSVPLAPTVDTSQTTHQIVLVQQRNLHPAKSLGRGLAPLVLSLTSAVAVLVAMRVLRPFSARALASPLNAFTVAHAGWLPMAAVTGTVTCGLFVYGQTLMGVGARSAWGTLAMCGLASLCFAALGQLLKVAFGLAGEALLLFLIALQFGAAGGLYPVEATNALFGNVHAYLPMTYSVQALHVTIIGGQAAHVWRAAAVLGSLTLACILLSTLLLSRRRQWTVQRLSQVLY